MVNGHPALRDIQHWGTSSTDWHPAPIDIQHRWTPSPDWHPAPMDKNFINSGDNNTFFLAVHNSSIGLIVPWSDQTNNQSLHNTTGWPLRLVTFETLDQTFWWQFLKTTFNDNFWWQFLMTIFDANFDDNFDDYFWWQVLMTIFGWQFFLGLIFNLWLVIFETLITILTIENLVSWQSLLPDN